MITASSSSSRGTGNIFSLNRDIDPTVLASLQTPEAQSTAAGRTSVGANIPGINDVELPDWLKGGADKNMSELMDVYHGIPEAFDPSRQVKARNKAIGYQTSVGGQAAANAATEYANRASQTGGSALGAGVVQAQALMPVFAANAKLRGEASDIAAEAHQKAAGLAASIATTIGGLRESYLKTLTSYAQGQQGLALDKYKAEQSVASEAAQRQLGYAQTQADVYKEQLRLKQQSDSEARLAATALLNAPGPSGMYQTDTTGRVVSGMDDYNRLKNFQSSRDAALSALGGMI